MKDMDPARQILGMHNVRNRIKKLLWWSKEKYVSKVLQKLRMESASPIGSTLLTNWKLCKDQSLKSKSENAKMSNVHYASAIGSLMYAMVCTRPDIGYVVQVVNRYMSIPGREHWATLSLIQLG